MNKIQYVLEKKKGAGIMPEPLDFFGGADENRTRGLLNAIQALSQLSYSPIMT